MFEADCLVAKYLFPARGILSKHCKCRVFLQPCREIRSCLDNFIPPVVVAIAFVKDIGVSGSNGHRFARLQVVDVGMAQFGFYRQLRAMFD